jgi:hypothetical protein
MRAITLPVLFLAAPSSVLAAFGQNRLATLGHAIVNESQDTVFCCGGWD